MDSRTIDLKAFKAKASKKKKTYNTFLKGIHSRKNGKDINKMAVVYDKEAFQKIDCLSCGNCCKTMTPTFTQTDISRISKHLNVSKAAFIEKYLERDKKDWVNKKQPCQFLGNDNKCSIYEIRPVDCAGFPHTHKTNPGFVGASSVNREFFWRCPIVYHVVDAIFAKVAERK
jgi:Fe-S-cluster containining protein